MEMFPVDVVNRLGMLCYGLGVCANLFPLQTSNQLVSFLTNTKFLQIEASTLNIVAKSMLLLSSLAQEFSQMLIGRFYS